MKELKNAIKIPSAIILLILISFSVTAGKYKFSIAGNRLFLRDTEIKIIGLRTSNALISDASAQQLIDNLDVFKLYGINTVSVYFMGSRFGDVKGYCPIHHLTLCMQPECRK